VTRPDVEISVALGQSPFAASSTLVWTDISADVLIDPAVGGGAITFRRGRQSELGTVEAGTLSLTLQNSARKYDPSNTSSVYFPNIRPMTRIRVRARYPQISGTYVTRWTGYVTAWQPAYPGPLQSVVQIRASDAFSALARAQNSVVSIPPGEASNYAIRSALTNIGWPSFTDYTFTNGSTTIAPGSYLNINALQYMQNITATEDGLFFIAANGFPTFQDRHYRINNATVAAVFGDNGTVNGVLSSGINASVTTLPLLSTAAFSPVGGVITIDSEQISYTGKTSSTLTGCTRAYHGTTAASHLSSATVSFIEYPYQDVSFSYDESLLYNDVQVTRAGGTLQEATTAIATTLNGTINASVTTITVVSAATFAAAGTIQIDNEQITYTGTSSTTFTGCTRGANGTTAASHTTAAPVYDPTTSTALYGPRVLSISGLYMVGDDEALGMAQWKLLQYYLPNLRVTSIVLNGELQPGIWGTCLPAKFRTRSKCCAAPLAAASLISMLALRRFKTRLRLTPTSSHGS
jgi:hypothetical protein